MILFEVLLLIFSNFKINGYCSRRPNIILTLYSGNNCINKNVVNVVSDGSPVVLLICIF